MAEDELQRGLIITDTYSKRPLLDFGIFSKTIVKMIKNSYPNFCVGIYGEWGIGKTTFMELIKKELEEAEDDKRNIITVWFDAWKYENEKQFALIPLLKTINYSIDDKEDEKKKNLKNALREAAIFTFSVSTDIVSSVVGNYAGKQAGELTKIALDGVGDRLIPELRKLRQISDIDSNGIFYDGIKRIQEAIDNLRKSNDKFRIVIFIDDLDRCSENKMLEILESMKIFLSLNGIIYILGISYERILELITRKYPGEKNDEYLKKFIQIPITISDWNQQEIANLIDDLLSSNVIHTDYQPIIKKYKIDISSTVQENPRELKRFLNNLIITYEAYKLVGNKDQEQNEIFLQQLLLVQILKSRWKDIYINLSNTAGKILQGYDKLIPTNETERTNLLKKDSPLDPQLRNLLDKYSSDEKLWDFLAKNCQILTNIPWEIFRRVTNFIPEFYEEPTIQALKLLKSGEIAKFNDSRGETGKFSKLDLSGADLNDSDLESANMRKLTLRNTKFERSHLYFVSFSGSDLTEANMRHGNFLQTSFTLANLTGANFQMVNVEMPPQDYVSYDAIYDIDLSRSNLSKADFSGAKLANAVIINPVSYEGMVLNDETDFSNAIIDEEDLLEFFKKYTSKLPNLVKSKEELREILRARDFDQMRIDFLLTLTKKPWQIKGHATQSL